MAAYTRPIQNVIDRLASLPGIGPRSAERIAFHLLKQTADQTLALADAVRDLKTKIRYCDRCYNLAETSEAETSLCDICSDARRDSGLVCVVEQPKDLLALESAGVFGGVYHVLLGRIAPLDGVDPEDLTIDALLERIASGEIREVILGTNPNVDGDLTATHLTGIIQSKFPNVAVTRLARGLAAGSQIEYANRSVLEDAIRGRQQIK